MSVFCSFVPAASQRSLLWPGGQRAGATAGGRDRAPESRTLPAEGEAGPHVPAGEGGLPVRDNASSQRVRTEEKVKNTLLCTFKVVQKFSEVSQSQW